MNNILKEDERIDNLEYKGLKIIQNKNKFCFGMDSVLLSDFAKDIKKGSTALDLGTGTGIIGILLCGKTNLKNIIGVELQKDMCDMAQRSIKLNNLENKFKIINDDIINIDKLFNKGTIDVVIANPPYKKIGSGLKNDDEAKTIARHEIKGNLEDFIKIASHLLKSGGEYYMVHRPERLVDIIGNLKQYKLEPKEIRIIYPKINKEPNLILIKAVKNAKPFLKIDSPLIVYNEDDKYTDEILQIYQKK